MPPKENGSVAGVDADYSVVDSYRFRGVEIYNMEVYHVSGVLTQVGEVKRGVSTGVRPAKSMVRKVWHSQRSLNSPGSRWLFTGQIATHGISTPGVY